MTERERVVQLNRLEQRADFVETIPSPAKDPQVQVDLRRCADGDGHGSGWLWSCGGLGPVLERPDGATQLVNRHGNEVLTNLRDKGSRVEVNIDADLRQGGCEVGRDGAQARRLHTHLARKPARVVQILNGEPASRSRDDHRLSLDRAEVHRRITLKLDTNPTVPVCPGGAWPWLRHKAAGQNGTEIGRAEGHARKYLEEVAPPRIGDNTSLTREHQHRSVRTRDEHKPGRAERGKTFEPKRRGARECTTHPASQLDVTGPPGDREHQLDRAHAATTVERRVEYIVVVEQWNARSLRQDDSGRCAARHRDDKRQDERR